MTPKAYGINPPEPVELRPEPTPPPPPLKPHRYFRATWVEWKDGRLFLGGEMNELPGPLDVCDQEGFDQGEMGCTLEDGTEITVYLRLPEKAVAEMDAEAEEANHQNDLFRETMGR